MKLKISSDAGKLILLAFGIGIFSVLMHQYNSWDFKNYHFYNAYSFINDRIGVDIAPAQMQTYFNPILDTFNYIIVKLFKYPVFYQFFFGILWVVPIALLFSLYKQLFIYEKDLKLKKFLIIASILIGFSDSSVVCQTGLGFTDAETCILIIASIYCSIRSFKSDNAKDYLLYAILSGSLLGLALGLKLTSAPFVAGLIFGWAYFVSFNGRNIKGLVLVCLSTLIVFLLIDGFWLWKMYRLYDNPIFPQFNDYFKSGFADFKQFKDDRFLPSNTFHYLAYPFYFFSNNSITFHNRNWRFPILVILSILAALKFFKNKNLFKNDSKNIWGFIIIFFASSYILWLKIFSIYRYIVPLPILSGALIVGLTHYIFKNKSANFLKNLLISLMMIFAITTYYPNYGKLSFSGIKVVVPNISKDTYVLMSLDWVPMSFLIPFFNGNGIFLSPQNNFMNLKSNNNMSEQIRYIVHSKGSDLRVIDYPGSSTHEMLRNYNIYEDKESCEKIFTNLDKAKFEICKLKHL